MVPAHDTGGPFPATRISAILALRSGQAEERRRAREQLAQVYWKPVYKYIRLKWNRAPDDAADLTQGFFLRVFAEDFFVDYDPARARFRTFLRTCLDRYIQREDAASSRLKRGGDAEMIPLDTAGVEAELRAASGGAPDEIFERDWVQSLFALAVSGLREHCQARDRALSAQLFVEYDLGEGPTRPTYADLAAAHGVTVETITNHLAYARREFRRVVLELLRELTASDAEFRDEARALLGIKLP